MVVGLSPIDGAGQNSIVSFSIGKPTYVIGTKFQVPANQNLLLTGHGGTHLNGRQILSLKPV